MTIKIVDEFRVKFADGTSYAFVGDSAHELILSPIFLKYFTICLLIFATLQQRSDIAGLTAWEFIALWVAVALSSAAWLAFIIRTFIVLRSLNYVKMVYTPFITVPIVIITEPVMQLLLRYVFDAPPDYAYVKIEYILQPIIVLFLLDMVFGNFVAPQHPAFRAINDGKMPEYRQTQIAADASTTNTDEELVPASNDIEAEQEEIIAPAQDNSSGQDAAAVRAVSNATILLNDEKIIVDEILTMQIEDHYLRVETISKNIMTRYKMSAAVSEIDPDFGFQINRSVWVARIAIASIYRTESYGTEIVLKNGNEFSVSRSRMSAVLENCRRWGIEVKPRE